MTTYSWPTGASWVPNRFELAIVPGACVFTGPTSANTDAASVAPGRWRAVIDLPPDNRVTVGAAREAFFDRLKGAMNRLTLGHLAYPAPRGTLRGTPTLYTAVTQGDNVALVQTTAFATALAGDMLTLAGQLVRVMADATADVGGRIALEFRPAARAAMSVGAPVVWNAPTATFRLAAADVPTSWMPGEVGATTLELLECP